MKKPHRILIVEDIAADVDLAKHAIHKVLKGCEFQVVETRHDFLKALETFQPDVIVSDYSLSHFGGMKALGLTLQHTPLTPLIIWTSSMSEDVAVDCMKAGANNYVLKEHSKRLGLAVIRALEERELLIARKQAEEKYQTIVENSLQGIFQSTPEGRFINVNPAMARIYGYDSPQDLLDSITNISHHIYVNPQDREKFTKLFQAQGSITNFECRNYRKDGSIIWTSTSARTVSDANGNVLYYEGFLQNITKRKQVEEDLKERERQLTTLFSNLPGPVYRCRNDADYTMEFISDGIAELSGYQAEDFRQNRRQYGSLIYPDDQERVWTEIQTAVEKNQPFELTYRILTATGEERWVWEKGQGILDTEGQLQALEGFITDITQRKQAEALITESEQRYRAVTDLVSDYAYSYRIAPEGSIQQEWVTDAYHRITGYEAAEMRGGGAWQKLIHPDDFACANEHVERIFAGQQSVAEYRIITKSGQVRYLRDFSRPLWDEKENRIVRVIGAAQDITERKEAEQALQNSEKRFRALIEHGLDSISLLAADGTLIWESPGAFLILDYAPSQFIGHNIFELMHPDDLRWTRELFLKLLQEPGSSQRGIFRLRHSDGTWRWVESIATNLMHEPSVNAIVVNYRDITERKRVEAKLQASESRYRLATQATKDVIWEWDSETNQLIWSENAQPVFGYSSEEVGPDATWWDERIHPLDRERVVSKLNRLTMTVGRESDWAEEYRLLLKDGSYAYVDDHAYIERDSTGRTIRMIGAMSNITERKRAEEALRESESRLVLALSGAQMSVWEWNLKTNSILWSPEFFEITGLEQNQFGDTFESFTNLIHDEDVARVKASAEKAVAEQTLFAEEFRMIRHCFFRR